MNTLQHDDVMQTSKVSKGWTWNNLGQLAVFIQRNNSACTTHSRTILCLQRHRAHVAHPEREKLICMMLCFGNVLHFQ